MEINYQELRMMLCAILPDIATGLRHATSSEELDYIVSDLRRAAEWAEKMRKIRVASNG